MERLITQRDSRGWRKLCSTAELHQTLHEAGVFERDPVANALAEQYELSLRRLALREEKGLSALLAGGKAM